MDRWGWGGVYINPVERGECCVVVALDLTLEAETAPPTAQRGCLPHLHSAPPTFTAAGRARRRHGVNHSPLRGSVNMAKSVLNIGWAGV